MGFHVSLALGRLPHLHTGYGGELRNQIADQGAVASQIRVIYIYKEKYIYIYICIYVCMCGPPRCNPYMLLAQSPIIPSPLR